MLSPVLTQYVKRAIAEAVEKASDELQTDYMRELDDIREQLRTDIDDLRCEQEHTTERLERQIADLEDAR